MKKYLLLLFVVISTSNASAQTISDEDVNQLRKEVSALKQQVGNQRSITTNQQRKISSLQSELVKSKTLVDSLQTQVGNLTTSLSSAEERLGADISKANQSVEEKTSTLKESISNKSIMGVIIILALALLAGLGLFLLRRKVSDSDTAINAVKDAQKKLEEESVKLDNQLVSLLNNQLNAQPTSLQSSAPDHSLVLKVADEITRIELNLSRMDPSVKGLKQLTKGIERIKNNYLSKGYEIADMLNKPYNEGMRINADFVLDENLEPGTRIITSITKPQVIFNGELIQKAIVTVTQNI